MNRTQCPHCFTIYVISDEQIRVSQGMVRCGTCKERFQADLVDNKQKIESFDPRNVFIEPISEQNDETDPHVADLIKNSEQVDFQLENFEEKTSKDSVTIAPEDFLEDQSAANYHEFSEEEVNPSQQSLNDDVAEMTDETSQTIDRYSDSQSDIENFYANDGNLIDEVNQLIEKKIIKPVETARAENTIDPGLDSIEERIEESIEEQTVEAFDTPSLADQPEVEAAEPEFSLSTKTKQPRHRWFYAFVLLLIVGGFSATLVYQLWLKQAISWPDDKRLAKAIAPVIAPIKAPIEKSLERFKIDIPERRNLSKLELVSARTAPHPTRSSTILLRVSLINGAEITQPLPWLELSLNDSDGRLVSRRSLSPDDYSYNNRIDEKIGPRELKKVTIELLKFPEHATGYELKLLNK